MWLENIFLRISQSKEQLTFYLEEVEHQPSNDSLSVVDIISLLRAAIHGFISEPSRQLEDKIVPKQILFYLQNIND